MFGINFEIKAFGKFLDKLQGFLDIHVKFPDTGQELKQSIRADRFPKNTLAVLSLNKFSHHFLPPVIIP